MITKSGKDYLNSRFNRIEQIQDLSTIQTTFLAIVFSLFIFSITAIITKFNPILTAVSFIMIAFEIILLYFLLLSIFPSDLELKLNNLAMSILITIFIFIYLGISYAEITVRHWITGVYEAGNVDVVIILFLACLIAFPLDYWIISPRYKKRFNELYINLETSKSNKILEILNSLLGRGIKKIGISFIFSIFIVIFTGLFENSSGYGLPFYWFYRLKSDVWAINYQNLYLNIIIFTIIFTIFVSLSSKYMKRNNNSKTKQQNIWEETSYFVKINKKKRKKNEN